MIVTVLPEIMADFRLGSSELGRASWAVTGYLIGFTAAMPLMGRIADRFGYRSAFIGALAVFALGSVAVALSVVVPERLGMEPQFSWMVGARVFQAAGGGALIPIAIASAGLLPATANRAVAYGLIGASAEAGGVMGPLWGGAITQALSWEWAFWLNIPPVMGVAALSWWMPVGRKRRAGVDLVSGALFAGLLSLTTLGLMRIGEPDGLMGAYLAGACVSGALLIYRHRRVVDPLIPRGLLSRLNFSSAGMAHVLIGSALIIGMITVPLTANAVLSASPLEGGLLLLRMTAAIGAGALIGGAATQRWGARAPAIIGLLLATAGFSLMSRWSAEAADPWMTVHLAVTGLGFGLLAAPIAESALHNVEEGDRGVASALITVARMVGMTLGLAAMTAWGTVRFEDLVSHLPVFPTDPEVQRQVTEDTIAAALTVFRAFFASAAVLCAFAIAPAAAMTMKSGAGAAKRGREG